MLAWTGEHRGVPGGQPGCGAAVRGPPHRPARRQVGARHLHAGRRLVRRAHRSAARNVRRVPPRARLGRRSGHLELLRPEPSTRTAGAGAAGPGPAQRCRPRCSRSAPVQPARRRFLLGLAALLPLPFVARRFHGLAVPVARPGRAPRPGRRGAPRRAGAAGIERAAAGFERWLAGYREGAEMLHGYGTGEIRLTGPSPALSGRPSCADLGAGSFRGSHAAPSARTSVRAALSGIYPEQLARGGSRAPYRRRPAGPLLRLARRHRSLLRGRDRHGTAAGRWPTSPRRRFRSCPGAEPCRAWWWRATSASSAPASAPRWWPRSSPTTAGSPSPWSRPGTNPTASPPAPRCAAAISTTARAPGERPPRRVRGPRDPVALDAGRRSGDALGRRHPALQPRRLQAPLALRRRPRLADLLRRPRSRGTRKPKCASAWRESRARPTLDPRGQAVPPVAAPALATTWSCSQDGPPGRTFRCGASRRPRTRCPTAAARPAAATTPVFRSVPSAPSIPPTSPGTLRAVRAGSP